MLLVPIRENLLVPHSLRTMEENHFLQRSRQTEARKSRLHSRQQGQAGWSKMGSFLKVTEGGGDHNLTCIRLVHFLVKLHEVHRRIE